MLVCPYISSCDWLMWITALCLLFSFFKRRRVLVLNVSTMGKDTHPVLDAKHHVCARRDKSNLESRFINIIKGYGVFTTALIQEGTFIVEYRGVLREAGQCIPDAYSYYFIYNNTRYCIDASVDDGSLGRLVNDDSNPNAKVKIISLNRIPHLCLFALRDIQPGEEITYDYGGYDLPWRRGTQPWKVPATNKMLFRVIISQHNIRKIKLDSVPESVDELKLMLKNNLELKGPFNLQYEDKDFQDFCNLTCIADLPKEKVTLRVVFSPSTGTLRDSGVTSACISASSQSTTSIESIHSQTPSGRSQLWPASFIIPSFSPDVELRLRQGNEAYRKDGVLFTISRDIKCEILDKLAATIYSYKAYPGIKEFESVAIALVEKHPCLKEPGSTSGWYGWKLSLKCKMGNYRQKLRGIGCQEVKVNSEKRGPGAPRGKRKKIKRPRRSETNFLPVLPQGKDLKSLEEEREQIIQEMKKMNPDMAFVDAKMSSTYSLRRQEIVQGEPAVSEMQLRWPALFTERQISMEFNRLVSLDLSKTFYEGLDFHLLKLLQLYRSKRFETMTHMTAILENLDKDASIQRKRTAVLQALPWYMRENPSKFIKMCKPTSREKDIIKKMSIGILAVVEEVKEPLPAIYNDVALVMEEQVVLRNLGDIPNAFVNLMGLFYILNMNYPKELKYTFEVIQCLFMGIGADSCTATVHTLKNKLLR